MHASDIMTSHVVTVGPDDSILQAARLMLQKRISGLPVADGENRLVGIVSEGDFLRRAETETLRRRSRLLEILVGPGRLAEEYARGTGRKISEIMTRGVITIAEDTPLDRIIELMERHRVKRLPVMRGDVLVGMVTRANLLHAVASLAREATPAAADDGEIRERLLSELNRHDWAPAGMHIVVRNGTVELWGMITDERARAAIRVAAENTPGVKAVNDHLVWLEPMSGLLIEP